MKLAIKKKDKILIKPFFGNINLENDFFLIVQKLFCLDFV